MNLGIMIIYDSIILTFFQKAKPQNARGSGQALRLPPPNASSDTFDIKNTTNLKKVSWLVNQFRYIWKIIHDEFDSHPRV